MRKQKTAAYLRLFFDGIMWLAERCAPGPLRTRYCISRP
jgi:hypothetical protein